MTTSCPELLTLTRRADQIRRAEIRRCRRLRDQPGAIAVADDVTGRLVAALLDPILAYARAQDRPAEVGRRLRETFDLA